MFDLEQELKNLPEDPGVYIMHDKDDKIIYVGKAKILKNRVRQYFQKNSNHTPKVLSLIHISIFMLYVQTSRFRAAMMYMKKLHRRKIMRMTTKVILTIILMCRKR